MPATPILSQRSLMMFKIQSDPATEAVPDSTADCVLVSNADIKLNITTLERDFYRTTLSNLPIANGRKLVNVTFEAEVKGSGKAGVAPKLGTMLRACGFAQVQVPATAAGMIGDPRAALTNTGTVVPTWVKSTAPTKNFGRYNIRTVVGGATAVAAVRVTGNPWEGPDTSILPSEEFSYTHMHNVAATDVSVDETDPTQVVYNFSGVPVTGETLVLVVGGIRVKYVVTGTMTLDQVVTAVTTAISNALTAAGYSVGTGAGKISVTGTTSAITVDMTGLNLVLTSGTTAIPLGASGATIQATWTGNLTLDDSYTVDLRNSGYWYNPISTGFETATIWIYYDGMLHRVTSCIGSPSFTNQTGNYGKCQFSFTGQYQDPYDEPLPTGMVYEISNPQQVELAQLMVGGQKMIRAQSFSLDMAIQTNPRDSVSHKDGYDGIVYTSRKPTGGVNPEMELESVEPYWKNLSLASILGFHGRVGTVPNNSVEFVSHSMQLSGINYTDRNGNRVYDTTMTFVEDSQAGDDEVLIGFV